MTATDTLQAYLDAFSRADVDEIAALYATTTSYRNPISPGALTSPDEVRTFEAPMFDAFTAVSVTVEQLVAQDDQLAARILVRATHTGEMQTPNGPVPATGKSIELHSGEFLRVDDDDRIVEHHRIFDAAAFMGQLGLL